MSAPSSLPEPVRTTEAMRRDVVRNVRAEIARAVLMFLGWLGGCSDVGPEVAEQLQEVIVSDPVSPTNVAAGAVSPIALAGSAVDEVTYVALRPGMVPDGVWATISRVGDGASIVTAVRDGGFDPVAVAAQAGDFIDIQVTGGGIPLQFRIAVRATRPPVVVRTQPPRKKRDVPMNAPLVVVFSEPIAEASLSAAVRLFRGLFPVAGTVRLLQGNGAAVAFIPTAPLARNSDYRLVVSGTVRDLEGDALAAGVTVAFTTGASSTGPAASITVSPDTVRITGATYQMTATVRDEAGNELVDQPVTWSTSDPTGLTVSPTGLLTALAAGSYYITATVNELSASAGVFVSAGPAASLEVAPAEATVGAAGDTIILTAVVRDASGRLLDHPSVTWTSSDAAVATAAADSSGTFGLAFGTVTGVSVGSVTITATSGVASRTASVTVVPPLPVASVTVTPASATLVMQATRQLTATVRDGNGKVLAGRSVTWASDNAAVATVDPNGLVTGVSEGATAVNATTEGVSDTAAITVTVLSFASLSPGGEHTCGLTSAGAAYCWGSNTEGQLGNGSTNSSSFPIAVMGGHSFTALSAGGFHTCGLTANGALYCWGANGEGQLGTGSNTGPEQCLVRGTAPCSTRPEAVVGGLTFSTVSAGNSYTCGLTTTGAAYCWGFGRNGQRGDGSTTEYRSIPAAVAGGLTFSALSAATAHGPTNESHTCGLTTTGAVYCWGLNTVGQLGVGNNTGPEQCSSLPCSTRPVAVTGGLTFSALSAGGFHTCGLTTAGDAYCWGWNEFGALGDGTVIGRLTPVAVSGGLTFAALSAGEGHTCGLTTTGAAYCWGSNYRGQLGIGSSTEPLWSARPVTVVGGLTFSALSVGGQHTCALANVGGAYCWGFNGSTVISQGHGGQLGTGSNTGPEQCPPWALYAACSTMPVKVAGQP